jgi:hypothetical protein
LAFLERQWLEKRENLARFVDRQAEAVHLVGYRDDNLDAEFAAAEQPGRFSVAIALAIDFASNQHRPAILESPSDAGVGEFAVLMSDGIGEDGFGPLGQFDFVSGGNPTAPQRHSFSLA